MKKLIVTFTIVLAFTSCYNVTKSVHVTPNNLIPKEDLIAVLTDIQIVEAGLSISENRKFEKELKPKYYKAVLDSNKLTLLQLKESINYYQTFPKVMEEIYDGVLANLSKIQNEVLIEKEEFDRINDSLTKSSSIDDPYDE